jgi:hypothetical protein
MARKRKTPTASKKVKGPAPDRDKLLRLVSSRHAQAKRLVNEHLASTGISGIKVHSIRFSVAETALAGGGCSPACGPDEECVLDSNGGVVQWTCVPK